MLPELRFGRCRTDGTRRTVPKLAIFAPEFPSTGGRVDSAGSRTADGGSWKVAGEAPSLLGMSADAPATAATRQWRFDPVAWEFPEGLPESRGDSPRWHILHTRSRQEKALAEVLYAGGVDCFLPLVRKVRHYGHRRRVVEAPLFPSYLFLWGTLETTYHATATRRTAGIVRVADQLRLDRELLQIRLALQGDAELDPYPFLEKGRAVRVTGGPFRGIEGLVDERRTPDRLILQIHTLGRATALEIDPSLVEPVD